MTWQNGRQLASVQTNSEKYQYTYNADGLRIGKTNGTVTTEYILNGSLVMRQIISDGTNTYVADYLYHETGASMAFAYYPLGGTPVYYFYNTNLQGDIVGIYDANGNKVVGFRYNAWGMFNTDVSDSDVCTATFIKASLFRYRSYIYDYEIGLYYLQSRYYDPEVGRFINADGYINANGDLVGYNLYAYCSNNPVMFVDPTGEVLSWLKAISTVVSAIIDIVVSATIIYECVTSEPKSQEFLSESDAVTDWANNYRSDSQYREKGAILYKTTDRETGTTTYSYGRTYQGFSSNTIPGFIIGYVSGGISSLFDPNKEMIGFIHSHPAAPARKHSDFPSDPDLFLLKLPGISEVYVVPYNTCNRVPSIIKASDKTSWNFPGHPVK